MAGISLRPHQTEAVGKMHNGCILCGDVGSGKSRTSLAYYYILNGGQVNTENYVYMQNPCDLYIITTARKRDTHEWEEELSVFLLFENVYKNKVTIDSWNNIKKYVNVTNAFFIFDEQRVVGYGAWTKSFLKIVKSNQWILLSATPGDKWEDYMPVFIANGFYKNKTQFETEHLVWDWRSKFPKISRYLNTGRLIRLRNRLLVPMDVVRSTIPHHEQVYVDYDIMEYKHIVKERWNRYTQKPIKNASEYCTLLRRIVNSDESRQIALLEIIEKHPKVIIFYNYDYELEILKSLYYGEGVEIAEWNGHMHQPIPETDKWIYLVQYTAGCEGWNCIKTDTIIFYSQNYSYRIMKQASGRIDRLNTPYINLYYYHLKSHAPIDIAISRALNSKKNFNEGKYFNQKG